MSILITPSARLVISSTSDDSIQDSNLKNLYAAFAKSPSEGLFTLAAAEANSVLPADFEFWREFSRRYLSEICHLFENTDADFETIKPPSQTELATLLMGVPPMPGAEYLTTEALAGIWQELDLWVRKQAASNKDALAGFLKDRAPLWHQVGRVCFHLAENKHDPDYPFAFLATYAPGVSQGSRIRYQPLSKALQEYAGSRNKMALVRLLSPIHRASENSGLIAELVESGDIYHPLAWTPKEAYRFLKEAASYEKSGVLVRLPDWWSKRPRPQVGVVIGEKRPPAAGAAAMLDFDITLALGGEKLTQKEWASLMDSDDGLVLFKGRWVESNREKLNEALDHWKSVERASQNGELSFNEGMRLLSGAPVDLFGDQDFLSDEAQWAFARPGQWLEKTLSELRDPENGARNKPAKALRATLRPYQQTGVEWLSLMTRLGLGACLADDMGLGKTVQVLAFLLLLKQKRAPGEKGRSLLVLPASLLGNWKSEMERFAPSLKSVFVHLSEADKETLESLAKNPQKELQGVDVVFTTYGMLQRQPWLLEVKWSLVILDEAQAIKNPSSRQTRTVKKLQAEGRIALTGTPVENRLSDLWSLFDFLCPGLLGSAAKFKRFVKSMDQQEQGHYKPLRKLVSPYILRRLKTDKTIISDLPEKSEVRAFCSLSKRQAALYKKSIDEFERAMEGIEGIKRRGLVLAYLMRFKQICNHPSQLLGDGEYRSADSGKFSRLAEICEEIASRQEKVLVFTQFREMTGPIDQFLTEVFQRSGLVLHGGTAVGKRKALVDDFQREEGPPYFVLSLKAGGTGLNLTAASHVIHFDRWWNPAVENQATDRAFRIGQLRNVLVHKFVCRGTIEERIDELIEEKKSLADGLLKGGAAKLLTEMSDGQLMQMVALDVDKAMA